MTLSNLKDKLSKAVAVVLIVAALFTMAATMLPSTAMAATSGNSCITGLCCTADSWWKCLWVPNWRFKYNPITMKCC